MIAPPWLSSPAPAEVLRGACTIRAGLRHRSYLPVEATNAPLGISPAGQQALASQEKARNV